MSVNNRAHSGQFLSLFVAVVVLILALAACAGPANGTGSLSVLMRDENGGPLPGAKVVSNTQPDGQLKVTGLTQADGTVIFNDIKAGDYEFYVSRFDYEQQDFSVTVAAGRTRDITITLVRSPAATTTS